MSGFAPHFSALLLVLFCTLSANAEDGKDLYAVLGVAKTATADEIKKAYRKFAFQYHPDRHPGDKAAEEKFKDGANAYEVLSDPEQRAFYDKHGSTQKTQQPAQRPFTSYFASFTGKDPEAFLKIWLVQHYDHKVPDWILENEINQLNRADLNQMRTMSIGDEQKNSIAALFREYADRPGIGLNLAGLEEAAKIKDLRAVVVEFCAEYSERGEKWLVVRDVLSMMEPNEAAKELILKWLPSSEPNMVPTVYDFLINEFDWAETFPDLLDAALDADSENYTHYLSYLFNPFNEITDQRARVLESLLERQAWNMPLMKAIAEVMLEPKLARTDPKWILALVRSFKYPKQDELVDRLLKLPHWADQPELRGLSEGQAPTVKLLREGLARAACNNPLHVQVMSK